MTGVSIHSLRLGQCRYAVTPHETDRHLFCAEPVERPGSPYCSAHAAVCFDRRGLAVRHAEPVDTLNDRARLARIRRMT